MWKSSLLHNAGPFSVNLLHLGCLVGGTLHLFEWRQIVVVAKPLVVIVNAKAELNHTMNAACELCGFVKVETRCQQRCVEKKPNEIFHGFVRFVCSGLFLQLCH